ncbi:hypothetical protein O6H91_Y253600 [Diphasiastrum complanatum]|nr:hypothetical protein O6H91_Y253600 [Diphasiastrum complanatum]
MQFHLSQCSTAFKFKVSVYINPRLVVSARKAITFHIGETSVTLPLSYESAKGLSSEISNVLAIFKEKENASRLQRWKSMEYEQRGEDGVFTEFFCNPNAYSNPFQAKVLITVSDEKIKFTSEAQLIAIKSDVDQFLEEHA